MNMRTETKEFFDVLYPSMERIARADTPIYSNLLLYGSAGVGKTLGIGALVEEAKRRYGPENVHATVTDGDVKLALSIGFDSRPIQIIAIDDLTLKKVDNKDLENFYKCRHLAMDSGMTQGYILTILVLHDFFAIPKHLRTYFDFLIACNPPTNRFDRNFLKSYFGSYIIDELLRLQRKKRIDDNIKAYKAYWFLGQAGFIKTEKPQVSVRRLSGWEDVLPTKYSPDKLKKRLDRICLACQEKKGNCRLTRICEDAYERVAKQTGLKKEQLFDIFMSYSGHVEEGLSKRLERGRVKKKEKEDEKNEEEPEGAASEHDMHIEDIDKENGKDDD